MKGHLDPAGHSPSVDPLDRKRISQMESAPGRFLDEFEELRMN